MWYKIDFDRLILLLLPTSLRKIRLFGYIKALISPINSLHYQWTQIRTDNLLKLSYNGQKCYLRKALNDKFDPELRRITISDVEQIDQDYLYTQSENLDVYLGVIYLEQEFNYVNGLAEFLVNVPGIILNTKTNEITAVVDFYKLAGKSYQLITI
ncbi:hypothetical protein QWY99_08420 [Flavobacterium branchiarum]|uniref:Uncharacterized protein n=1 Tax=Flavobacterium branchiarum TaxID=1114870 RepID=A0ABV5FPT2_9FLAO|nr:hypothetical protein [Flavobacterium branchiarum]MDN3673070.1 hypothetical protein [Flavobacterium branchiarum]